MSSVLGIGKQKNPPAEPTIWDHLERVFRVAAGNPQITGTLLILGGIMIKQTRTPAHQEKVTQLQTAYHDNAAPTHYWADVTITVPENPGLDMTLIHVSVGDVESTVLAPLAALAGVPVQQAVDSANAALALEGQAVYQMINPFANPWIQSLLVPGSNPIAGAQAQAAQAQAAAKALPDTAIVRLTLGDILILGGIVAIFGSEISKLISSVAPAVAAAASA